MDPVRQPSPMWFGGDTNALEPDEVVFADEVRRRAGRLAPRVAPVDTWAVDALGGCLLLTRLPDVPSGEAPVINNHLQVMYRGASLSGYWGCSHYWDEFDPTDPDALVAKDVEGPLEAAIEAIGWIDRQVRRPLVRREWLGLFGMSTAWVFTDTGQEIGARGRRRRMLRHFDQEVELWPNSG